MDMERIRLPALYRAADEASNSAQATHVLLVAMSAVTGILGAALSIWGVTSRPAAVASAIVLLVGLAISVAMAIRNAEAGWYRARALAESVKTVTWRFMMGSDPFDGPDANAATTVFAQRLERILAEHKDLAREFAGFADDDEQVTPDMLMVRGMPLEQRKTVYFRLRIDEQRKWYAGKAKHNRRKGRFWLAILVVVQAAAVISALLRIWEPSWRLLPTEVLVVAGASALGWMQGKRFRELSAAYSLTAQEIGLAASGWSGVTSEEGLADFVGQIEGAFSREHTQWVARKELK